MNASNRHASKLHKYTVLDTVFKLENKKVKIRTVMHFFFDLSGA